MKHVAPFVTRGALHGLLGLERLNLRILMLLPHLLNPLISILKVEEVVPSTSSAGMNIMILNSHLKGLLRELSTTDSRKSIFLKMPPKTMSCWLR